MNFKNLLFLSVFLFFPFGIFAEQNISYISDNVYMSDLFNTKYIDIIQSFVDDDFGKNKIKINKISKFDMNTTQCLELFDALYTNRHQDALILMIGESNYHNLYGFSSYMKQREEDKPIVIKEEKNIYEINNEILKIYSKFNKNTLSSIVSGVYKTVIGDDFFKTFKPKVVPNFYVLNNSFHFDNNILSAVESYKYAWNLIRNKNFDEAKLYLKNILEKKPSQSILYYTLGSLYLAENKENSELNALQCFEDGILVDPLNRHNVCYKGLALLYMIYKGEITAETLYFARILSNFITFPNDELETIMTINTVDYNKKIEFINDWIISDVNKLVGKARLTDTKIIFTSYPEDIPINSLIHEYTKDSSKTLYVENKADDRQKPDLVIYNMAKKMYEFLKEKNIFK